MTTIKPPPFTRVIKLQFTATVLFAVLVGLAADGEKWVAAYSALAGGLISAIPGAYFAYKTFQHRGARSTTKMIASVFKGEAIKLGLIAAGFAAAFAGLDPIAPSQVFAGFVVTHCVGIFGAYRMTRRAHAS